MSSRLASVNGSSVTRNLVARAVQNVLARTRDRTEIADAYRTDISTRNDAAWRVFQSNNYTGIFEFEHDGPAELNRFMELLVPVIQESGRRYVVGRQGIFSTLTPENIGRVLGIGEVDSENSGSDQWNELEGEAENGRGFVTVQDFDSYMRSEVSGVQRDVQRQRPGGAFFPFTHNYGDDPHLGPILAELGCYPSVTVEDDNCLINACKAAGMSDVNVTDLKTKVRRRKVSMCVLNEFAKDTNQCISVYVIKEGGSKKNGKGVSKIYNGPADGKPFIELCLYEDHYFVKKKVAVTKYALANYAKLKNRPRWWEYVSDKRRDAREIRQMFSFDLLMLIDKAPITADDSAIYETYYHDRVNLLDGATLTYPDCAVKPFSKPNRSSTASQIVFFDIETATQAATDLKTNVELMELKVLQNEGKEHLDKLMRQVEIIDEPDDASDDEKMVIKQCNLQKLKAKLAPYCCHSAYLLCCIDGDGYETQFTSGNLAKRFLTHLAERYGGIVDKNEVNEDEKPKTPTVILCAHNATYDWQILMPYLSRINLVNKGTNIVCGSAFYSTFPVDGVYHKIRLEFKDSYKTITMPLSGFAKSFNLSVKKEVLCYSWYTDENILRRFATAGELRDHVPADQYVELLKNLDSLGCLVGDRYDMLEYSKWYCQQDCRVLRDGYNVFRDSMLEFSEIDINAYPTLAGLADQFMTNRMVYGSEDKDDDERVCAVSGVVQQFIRQTSIGGRVMARCNTRSLGSAMCDFDAVSLFPSAMKRLPGVLLGKPKVWTPDVDLEAVDGYFIDVKVTKVGRCLPFPVHRIKENKANVWTNDLVGKTICVNKFTLEDMVLHQQIEYEVVRGYYYDSGRDPTISSVIVDLFEQRKKYKKIKSPLQLVIKLLMNCSYGITGLKPIECDVSYVANKDFEVFCKRNYDRIKEFTKIGRHWRVELYKELEPAFNRIHIASEILSMARVIMNEVMVLAEDIGIKITYTDTDSVHLPAADLARLSSAYEAKYDRVLCGDELGQFNSDFEFDGCYATVDGKLVKNVAKSVGDLLATMSIIVGKKCYLDVLEDQAGNVAYHIRIKGVPHRVLLSVVNRYFGGDPVALYMALYRGEEVRFDFNLEDNFVFRRRKDHRVYSCDMARVLSFPPDKEVVGEYGF